MGKCLQFDKNHIAIYQSKIGIIKIEYIEECLVSLKMIEESSDLLGERDGFSDLVFKQVEEYLEGTRMKFTVPFQLQGTAFQVRVWEELCNIPYGETRTYKEIARAVGNEKASRAIGMANHHNPIWLVVPCHRVIGSNGKLVGYAGGISIKEQLIAMEQEHRNIR
ncbi:MAG: methylated-DNA--[protein]-cysteine S-methyltransferase [Eubacteriales bacterium]